MDYDTVRLDDENNAVVIIDQTKLPGKIEIISLHTAQEIWDAIYLLQVRGAPAIGVAAAYGIYVLAKQMDTEDYDTFYREFVRQKEYLDSSRPTAVNLSWALNRMQRVVEAHSGETVAQIKEALHRESVAIQEEDIWVCRMIGEHGLTLVKPGDGILTHCNAGQLARLTAFELQSSGVDVTLICDNMSATVMKNGWVNAVFVGCDRVAANGDAANKIGTSVVAAVAKYYGVPVYICAPTSTIDLNTPTGAEIKIEQRPAEEVTEMWYKERMAPEGIKVFNPAFDVTDHELIAGIVTEYGVARAPYTESLAAIFAEKEKRAREKKEA